VKLPSSYAPTTYFRADPSENRRMMSFQENNSLVLVFFNKRNKKETKKETKNFPKFVKNWFCKKILQ